MKKKIKKPDKKRTVTVRFLSSPAKLYTYSIRQGANVHLDQELVVDNQFGTSVVVVVAIDRNDYTGPLKQITRKVCEL